jgi:hypothetical protein
MCAKCVNAVLDEAKSREWEVDAEGLHTFLWCCTCFPFGVADKQTHEMFDLLADDCKDWNEFLDKAMAHAKYEMDKAMKKLRESEGRNET